MSKTLRFHAVCRLTRSTPERNMTAEQVAEAKAAGCPRVFRRMDSERVNREPGEHRGRHGRFEWVQPACDGFETTDPQAFERHMTDEHGRTVTRPRPWTVRNGMWTGPRLTEDGRPWEHKKHATRTCGGCGLVAEVTEGSPASELWWAEHERGCAYLQSGVAS